MPASVHQSDICRLHECVDKNNFKNAVVLSTYRMLTVLRNGESRFSRHFPPSYQESTVSLTETGGFLRRADWERTPVWSINLNELK